MKKTIALFLLFSLILITISCGNGGSDSSLSTDTATAADTSSEVTDFSQTLSFEEVHAAAMDDLPEADFGGAKFVITINNYTGCEDGFLAEMLTGDVLNDAVYNRNTAVEERFNIDLDILSYNYEQIITLVKSSVLAGEDYYQLLNQHVNTAAQWVTGEILYDWNELPYVDFTKPWWSTSNKTDLTYHSRTFLAVGDYGLTTLGRTYAIYYDKVEAESNNIPDLYTLVFDEKWTIDTMLSYSKDAYRDLNANGQRDTVEDFFGFSTSTGSNIAAWLWAFGEKIIDDGEIVLHQEKYSDILSKMLDIIWNANGTCYDLNYKNAAGNTNYLGVEKLAAGTTLFCAAMIDSGILYLRDSVHDYGILPFPKWDTVQDDYYTIVDPGFTAIAIPKTITDKERAGILAEALCAETYRLVVPSYYEYALKQKGTRDEQSIEMMDYILSKRVYDFGLVYDNGKGFYWTLGGLIKNHDSNFASYYAANIDKIRAYYKSVFEVFENYG